MRLLGILKGRRVRLHARGKHWARHEKAFIDTQSYMQKTIWKNLFVVTRQRVMKHSARTCNIHAHTNIRFESMKYSPTRITRSARNVWIRAASGRMRLSMWNLRKVWAWVGLCGLLVRISGPKRMLLPSLEPTRSNRTVKIDLDAVFWPENTLTHRTKSYPAKVFVKIHAIIFIWTPGITSYGRERVICVGTSDSVFR